MMLTVYRQPVLMREGERPQRTSRALETFKLEAVLLPGRRVKIRFPFGDWLPFCDDGEPARVAMADYVLAPESVAIVAAERAKEAAERKAKRRAEKLKAAGVR